MDIIYYIAKAFCVSLVLALVVAAIWFFTDVKANFKWYRKQQGGRWYKYHIPETDDYFWSDDWTFTNKIIEIEEH